MFNDDEAEVSEILLELPSLIFSETKPRGWGIKRKRSDAVAPSLCTPVDRPEPSSPSTPVSNCPSESDEKPFKLPKQITETPKKIQEHIKTVNYQELLAQKFIRRREDMLKNTTMSMTNIPRNLELNPETKNEEQVPQLDLEMRLGLPTIDQDVEEPHNNIQQQNDQQQITMEVEVIKEETITMKDNAVGKFYSTTLPLSMNGTISLSRVLAKWARQWRLKVLREKRYNSS